MKASGLKKLISLWVKFVILLMQKPGTILQQCNNNSIVT